ncbi:unnamed protein product, partial [Ectocarpus sp. 13 AM-2016]
DGSRAGGAGVDKINEEAFRPHHGGVVGGVLLRRQPADSTLPETTFSFRTAATPGRPSDNELASSRRLMPPPPRQQVSTATVSKGSAIIAASGSPLVASAHEGLQRMRAVLEQRALEVGRAHDDSKEM